jgi:dTDP-4-dehydrorhamnose reductase
MTRILLTGQDGQVGQELLKTLAPLGEVIGVARPQLDLAQPDQIQRVITEVAPHLIVNAAAYTAVDKAESEPDLAYAINGAASQQMAELAQSMGAPLIHISTDYVFDGSKNTPYVETDATHPLSVYGKSKLAGETAIQQVAGQHPNFRYAILRTAWVYGVYGKGNFVKTMLRLGAERPEVRVVADQVGSPTWAAEIAKAIAALATQFVAPSTNGDADSGNLSGIYHFTNSGVTSWYDFAVAVFEEAEALGIPLKLEKVTPITTAEYPTPAQRPAYSVLANQKIQQILKVPAPQWRQSLRQMLTELYATTYESNYSLRR